uniref:Uncharacterized protein n=1 Tax=Arundo donax TaxID=35708 RepID=A0A0A9CLE3_ARUDO
MKANLMVNKLSKSTVSKQWPFSSMDCSYHSVRLLRLILLDLDEIQLFLVFMRHLWKGQEQSHLQELVSPTLTLPVLLVNHRPLTSLESLIRNHQHHRLHTQKAMVPCIFHLHLLHQRWSLLDQDQHLTTVI